MGSARVWEVHFILMYWACKLYHGAQQCNRTYLLGSAWVQISSVTQFAIIVLTEEWKWPYEAPWIFISIISFISIYLICNIFITKLIQNQRNEALNPHASEIWGVHTADLWCIHVYPEITTGSSWKRFGCGIWMIQRDLMRMAIVCKRSLAIGL